jgi:hypothetical protein
MGTLMDFRRWDLTFCTDSTRLYVTLQLSQCSRRHSSISELMGSMLGRILATLLQAGLFCVGRGIVVIRGMENSVAREY